MKKEKLKGNIIEIPLEIFKIHVIVIWEMTVKEVATFFRKRGCDIDEQWEKEVSDHMDNAQGVTVNIGKNNTDVLVWLKKRPRKASQYNTLYHELYHAIERLAKSHEMDGDHALAHIYAFLATECNQILWNLK